MKVYLARHGESLANAEDRWQNDSLDGLTEKGRLQAEAAAGYLLVQGLKVVYSSPKKRALQTAGLIAGKAGCNVRVVQEFRDTDFGVLGGMTLDGSGCSDEIKRLIAEREKDKLHYRPPGGESFEDVKKRCVPSVKRLLAEEEEKGGDGSIAIVAHLNPNRVIIGQIIGLDLEKCHMIRQPNDLIYVIDSSNKTTGYFWNGIMHEGLLLKQAL
ncbi:histidine phosphatase family protein [Candidatus Woesearchaeota archaeon]|nr:histidine phosphatase family protein [Candidatus Woesearchaeota archaeon]